MVSIEFGCISLCILHYFTGFGFLAWFHARIHFEGVSTSNLWKSESLFVL